MMQVKQLLEQLPGQDLTEQEQQEIAAQDSSQLAKALLEACNGATEATAVEVCPLRSATFPDCQIQQPAYPSWDVWQTYRPG